MVDFSSKNDKGGGSEMLVHMNAARKSGSGR
jgi:hypothetical protein